MMEFETFVFKARHRDFDEICYGPVKVENFTEYLIQFLEFWKGLIDFAEGSNPQYISDLNEILGKVKDFESIEFYLEILDNETKEKVLTIECVPLVDISDYHKDKVSQWI